MPVRRAGRVVLADGRTITWSVAAGRRGRRWRTSTTGSNGALESVVLLELATSGALSKLEVAASDGLLTLHPEGEHLHGNVIDADGVRHLTFDWGRAHALVLEGVGLPVLAAARTAVPTGVGERRVVPAIVVRRDLDVAPATVTLECLGPNTLAFETRGHRRVLELDHDQIPVELRSGGDWPLELD